MKSYIESAKPVRNQGLLHSVIQAFKSKGYRRKLENADKAITKELDLVNMVHRIRFTTAAVLALMTTE